MLRHATYDTLVTALLFLGIVLTCGLSPMQSDTWWQLRAGRDMWMSKQVLLTDVYSHTAYGAFWPNHEWLAEVVFYLLYRAGGFPLLTLFAAGLISIGWAFTWRLTSGSAEDKFIWIGLALVPSAGWWEPRPHAFSLLFIPTLAYLLVRDRIWWLPLVFLVWANVHGGVLLGFLLLLVGLAVQTLTAPRSWRRSLLVAFACALAVTTTPLGLDFWTEIPQSLSRINQYTLDEWKRPRFSEAVLLPFWILAATFCAVLVRHRDRLRVFLRAPRERAQRVSHAKPPEQQDITLVALALVLLPAAVSAVRNVGPFLMVAIPALTALIHSRTPRPARVPEHPVLNVVLMSAAAAGVTATLAWAYLNQIPKLKWRPVPSEALAALRQCPDNLYNRYDEGGPLLWFAPDRKVFLDGRQDPFPPELVLEHIEVEEGRRDHAGVFASHSIRCAYLPVTSPTARRLSAAGWKSLYDGPTWVVLRQ